MGNDVSWRVELAIKPGELENFRALTGEMVASTAGEIGVLSYERFVSEDGNFVHVHERYADSASAWIPPTATCRFSVRSICAGLPLLTWLG